MNIVTEKSLKAVFYLISEDSLKARDLCLCRIIEKAFANKCQAYIYTCSAEETKTLDEKLWTFRDISFIPHAIYDENYINSSPAAAAPILIGQTSPPKHCSEILVNLAPTIPSFYQQFTHIIEIAPNNEQLRANAREHYKYYQRQGYKPESYNIAANADKKQP